MIISASRRTDIPAFYSQWFINRIRSGFCNVPNPFNARQVSKIDLNANSVDAFVFWTRYARPLMPFLKELDTRTFNYYFLYTITGYGQPIERYNPPVTKSITCFKNLSKQMGPKRIIWRYDPVILSSYHNIDYHINKFRQIASCLKNYTSKCIISILELYKKTTRRLSFLQNQGIILDTETKTDPLTRKLLIELNKIAKENKIAVFSCAQEVDYSDIGILPGRCIDNELLSQLFPGTDFENKKDTGQRKNCGCVKSRDIGMNNSCLFGCRYCYATVSHKVAKKNRFENHFYDSPSLLGWHGT